MPSARTTRRTPRQMSFDTRAFRELERTAFGGDLHQGLRKAARPIHPDKPLHVILKSSRARGAWSLRRSVLERPIRALVDREARRARVRILQYANAGNHLHLIIHARQRVAVGRFLKSIAGLIARLVTGAKKGLSIADQTGETSPGRQFWDALPFSRIVEWGRDLNRLEDYVRLNDLEGTFGFAHQSPLFREKRTRGS